ncbi:MAG: hypothetical protein D6816_00310, partial [Bacteroidetes bacterium]
MNILKSKGTFLAAIVMLAVVFSCKNDGAVETGSTQGEPLFTVLSSSETGVDFSNDLEENPLTNHNVLSYQHYYNGAGVAVGDV